MYGETVKFWGEVVKINLSLKINWLISESPEITQLCLLRDSKLNLFVSFVTVV
jgi:hypothetical protein